MYIINEDFIVFDYKYNEPITNKICDVLSKCNMIIFSDYGTFQSTMKRYKNPYPVEKSFKKSIFNKPLDNLPISIKKLFLGYSFNYLLDNLPTDLRILRLGFSYSKSLDYLPMSIEVIFLNTQPHSLDNLPKNIEIKGLYPKYI